MSAQKSGRKIFNKIKFNKIKSKNSGTTRTSKGSSRSTIVSAKLKEAEKKIQLKLRAEKLEEMHQLETEKLRIKLKEEQMKIEEELAINEAKCKIIKELEDERSSTSSVTHGSRMKHSSEDVLNIAQHLSKPKMELQTFSGDCLQYHRFMRQFKAKVIANCDDPEERLNYLEQYTSGEPRQIVIGFSYLDAEKGYKAAIRELDERYGDQEITVQAFFTKALSWTPIKADNPKELDRFAVFLSECDNAIKCIDAMKILEYSDNLKKIVAKLPFHMHDRWRSIVYQTKERGQRVTFSDLVKYIRMEAKKASDPIFGREAISKTMDSKTTPIQYTTKSHATNAEIQTQETDTAVRRNAFTTPCIYWIT